MFKETKRAAPAGCLGRPQSLGVKPPKQGNLGNPCLGEPFTCIFRAGTNAARPVWIRGASTAVSQDCPAPDSPQIPDAPAGFLESWKGSGPRFFDHLGFRSFLPK